MNKTDRQDKIYGVYIKSMLQKRIQVPITQIGSNIEEVLTKKINKNFSGKCINEGYIKINSCNVISYSSGILEGSNVRFEILYEWLTKFLYLNH